MSESGIQELDMSLSKPDDNFKFAVITASWCGHCK
jgi:hypothetical protein